MPTKPKRVKTPKAKAAKPKGKAAASYLITDIDGDVYARFKQRAAANGQEMKFLFLRFIREFADGQPTTV